MFPPVFPLANNPSRASPPAAAEREADGSRGHQAGRGLCEDGEGEPARKSLEGGDGWGLTLTDPLCPVALPERGGDQHAADGAAVQNHRVPPAKPR